MMVRRGAGTIPADAKCGNFRIARALLQCNSAIARGVLAGPKDRRYNRALGVLGE